MIGGVSFRDVVRRVCDGALATLAVGTCAFDGGIPGAAGGPSERWAWARSSPRGR